MLASIEGAWKLSAKWERRLCAKKGWSLRAPSLDFFLTFSVYHSIIGVEQGKSIDGQPSTKRWNNRQFSRLGGYFFFVRVTINIMICTMNVNKSINASHVTMYIALLSLLIGGKRIFYPPFDQRADRLPFPRSPRCHFAGSWDATYFAAGKACYCLAVCCLCARMIK